MDQINPKNIADRLESYSSRLRTGSMYRALGLWTTWQSFNDAKNPLRADDLARHPGAQTINLLASAALHETIIILVRALDGIGWRSAQISNRVSFPILVELAGLEGVANELEDRSRRWFEDGYRADENAETVRHTIEKLRTETERVKNAQPSIRLRDFRDEFLAHNLEFDKERDRPIIDHITTLLQELKSLSDMASLAFGGSQTAWDFGEQDWDRNSNALWKLIEKAARNT